MFVQIVPQFMAVMGSFTRIQQFLVSETREDSKSGSTLSGTGFRANAPRDSSIELTELQRTQNSEVHAVSIENGAFGWSESNDPVLEDVNFKMKRGDLAMVVGPVGSGKSTLLKAILGETKSSQGQVSIATPHISFCDQTPWLLYGTIRENIIGMTDFDPVWYRRVVNVCALQKDVDDMPDGDQTFIGSRGLALSGGQKQRIVRQTFSFICGRCSDSSQSIARTIYARNDLAIFDDVLAGLDATTEEHIFSQVFGREGLLRKLGTTVILVTNRSEFRGTWEPEFVTDNLVRRMRSADKIVAVGKGKILEQGSFDKLSSMEGYFKSISRPENKGEISSKEDSAPLTQANAQKLKRSEHSTARADGRRQTGDLTVYNYYCKSAGWQNIISTISLDVASAFCVVFSS